MLFAAEDYKNAVGGILEVVMWYVTFIALLYIPFLASFDPKARFFTLVLNVTGGEKLTRGKVVLVLALVICILISLYILTFGVIASVLKWWHGVIYDYLASQPEPANALRRPIAAGLTAAVVMWAWFWLLVGTNSAIGKVRQKLGKEITPPPRGGLFG